MMRAATLAVALAVASLLAWLLPRLSAPPDRFTVARHLLETGRADEAVHLFDDHSWRGVAEYRAGRYHRALAEFVQTESVDALYNMGNAYARLHEWPAAKEAYDRALALDPGHADARHNLALVARAEAAARREREEAQTTRKMGRWRDGDRTDPGGDDGGDTAEKGDAAGGEMRPADAPRGIPGEGVEAGLPGDEPASPDARAGPSNATAPGATPPEVTPGAGGTAILRESAQNAEILLGRIRDDPARVLAARLRAAHRRQQGRQ